VENLAFFDKKMKVGGGGLKWGKLKINLMMMNGLKRSSRKSKPSKRTVRQPTLEDCVDAMKMDMEFYGINMELLESIVKKLQLDQ
jgi:hypothetical protein